MHGPWRWTPHGGNVYKILDVIYREVPLATDESGFGADRLCAVPSEPSREDLMDRIEELEAGLESAVAVAIRHGAGDWARMNDPSHPALQGAGAGREGARATSSPGKVAVPAPCRCSRA